MQTNRAAKLRKITFFKETPMPDNLYWFFLIPLVVGLTIHFARVSRDKVNARQRRLDDTQSELRRRNVAFVKVIDPEISALSKNRSAKAAYHDSFDNLKAVAIAF